MNLNLNDFLQYANTGTAPAVYIHQKVAETIKHTHKATDEGFAVLKRAHTIKHPPIIKQDPVKPALELVMYSERSFAIFGDTKPVKDLLTGLFGKFNPYLKKEGVATPGYIFSIGRLDAVKKALNL